jgi:hypothetical protein
MSAIVLDEKILECLAQDIEIPERGKFIRLGENSYCYPQPLKITEDAKETVAGYNSIAPIGKTITRRNLPDTLKLLEKINGNGMLDVEIRLGGSEENLNAFRLKEAQDYRKNVLHQHSVWTGEMARPNQDACIVNRVDVKKVDIPAFCLGRQEIVYPDGRAMLAVGGTPHETIDQVQYVIKNQLWKRPPTRKAKLHDFCIIPTDNDTDPNGDILWNHTEYSKDGFGAIICEAILYNKNCENELTYYQSDPLWMHNNKAIPIFTSSLK